MHMVRVVARHETVPVMGSLPSERSLVLVLMFDNILLSDTAKEECCHDRRGGATILIVRQTPNDSFLSLSYLISWAKRGSLSEMGASVNVPD